MTDLPILKTGVKQKIWTISTEVLSFIYLNQLALIPNFFLIKLIWSLVKFHETNMARYLSFFNSDLLSSIEEVSLLTLWEGQVNGENSWDASIVISTRMILTPSACNFRGHTIVFPIEIHKTRWSYSKKSDHKLTKNFLWRNYLWIINLMINAFPF